eukprot:3333531-Prymnesium_polylepis.1
MRLRVHVLDPAVSLAPVDQLAVDADAARRRGGGDGSARAAQRSVALRHPGGSCQEERYHRPKAERPVPGHQPHTQQAQPRTHQPHYGKLTTLPEGARAARPEDWPRAIT